MNQKQSVYKAIKGEKPGKTPLFISAYWDYWVRAAGEDPFDWAYKGYEKQLEIEIKASDRHSSEALHRTRGCVKTLSKEDHRKKLPPAGLPPWTELIEKYIPELVVYDEAPEKHVEKTEDIESVIKSDRKINCGSNTQYLKKIVDSIGKDKFIAASGFSLFPHVRRCMGGIERTMFALIENPGLLEQIMEALLHHYEKSIKKIAQAGADGIWNGAYNEGADMISPKTWRKLILPYHKRFADVCHKYDVKAICWFLGDCMPLIEDIKDAGYDLLMLEQPRIGYRVDLKEIRKRVGNDLCFSGWLPELTILNDDREGIKKHIYEQYEAAGRDGAFIFSTSMLDSNVDPETIDYICELVDSI